MAKKLYRGPSISEAGVLRYSGSRVLLLDRQDRILLLEHVATDPNADFASIWVPPGGGIETGETAADAALRELWEETGLRVTELGPQVWRRHSRIRFEDGQDYAAEEAFFVCRIDSHDVGGHENVDEAERFSVLGSRWWALVEIEESAEAFAPRDLASLLAPILKGIYPAEPVEVEEGGGRHA